MKLVSIFLIIISKFSATCFAHDKLDMIQSAIDNYFASKNSSQSIKLPRFTLTAEDSSCAIATTDLLRQALRFLGKCKIGDKELDCMNPNWAVRLLESYPIKPAALARRGPIYMLADFETCRQLFHSHSAHYCLARGATSRNTSAIPFTIGMCLPQACEPSTLRRIVRDRVELDELWCQNGADAVWMSRKYWVLLVVLAIFAVLVIATLMEKLKAKGLIEMKNRRDDDDSVADNRSDTTSIVGGVSVAPSIALTYRNFQHFTSSRGTIPIDLVTAFAVQTSVAHLFRNATRECRLINGMRVWTSFWVIFSHTCLFSLQFTDTIREVLRESSSHPLTTAFMLNSSLAVDTFLFISGCVAAYSLRRKAQFRGKSAAITAFGAAKICLHRLLRYWPALMLYLAFMRCVYTHLSQGPFWNTNGMFGSQCGATQWSLVSHALFASNIWPSQCVPWLWHISLDFQLHLALPLCLVAFAKLSWRRATAAILSLVAACLTYRLVAYTKFDVPANIFVEMLSQRGDASATRVERVYRLMYTMPVSRAPPFLIGVLTGWMILSPATRATNNINATIVAVALQLVAAAMLAASLLGNVRNAAHVVAHRAAWATGLAIFVALANRGHARWLTYVLGSHRYTPLSRLSFGVFLAHEPILLAYLNSMHQPISNFSAGFLFSLSLAVYALSLFAAWLIAIVIEIPLITLERRVLMRPATSLSSSSRLRATPRRVSFNDDGDTIFGGDDDDDERGEVSRGDADNERDETRIELGHHPEMTYDEKTQNWLQNGGRHLIAPGEDDDQRQPEREHNNESTC